MTYSFGEASKDAERIENFLQRLAKAREIFKLVGDAEIRIKQLKATERSVVEEVEVNRARYASAKILTDEKVQALKELRDAAEAEAVQAAVDANFIIGEIDEDVSRARSQAQAAIDKLAARAAEMDSLHRERVAEMDRIEKEKRAQIAAAESQRRAIIQQLLPEGE